MNKHYLERIKQPESHTQRLWERFKARGGIEWTIVVIVIVAVLWGFERYISFLDRLWS